METPCNSGLFDSEDDGRGEPKVKQETEQDSDQNQMVYSPTPSVKSENDAHVKDEVESDGFTATRQGEEDDTPVVETWANAAIARTVETPSCATREVIKTPNETGVETVDAEMITCATAETSNNHVDSSRRLSEHATQSGTNGPRWELGTPYFRSDGPHAGQALSSTGYQTYGMDSIMPGTSAAIAYGQRSLQMQPIQYALGPHPTGQYGPMNMMGSQEGYAQQYNGEIMRQNRAGTLMTTVPIAYGMSPPSSGRSSPYTPTRYPQRNCTPMADVESTVWAQLPAPSPINQQRGARRLEQESWQLERERKVGSAALFTTPLARSQAKRQRKRAQGQHTHGERVVVAADAMRLWRRLGEDVPSGPRKPEEGFAYDAIRIATRGREHVQIAMERGPTSAQANWRSVVRTCRRREGDEDELFGEYRSAVRNYAHRHGRRLQ